MEKAEKSPSDRQIRALAAAGRVARRPGVASFGEQRPESIAQRTLADAIERGLRTVAQRALTEGMQHSPRLMAQRKQLTGIFGEVKPRGRVKPTLQTKRGHALNTDQSLERAADRMGESALQAAVPPAHGVLREHAMAPGAAVVQRNISTAAFEHSTNYFINPVNRHTLYSNTASPAPAPEQLYAKRTEFDDHQQVNLHAWQPNVRFLDVQQKTVEFENMGPRW